MFQINENYLQLNQSYLFSTIARKVEAFSVAHPGAGVIRLGIGDVTLPISPAMTDAMHRAVDEMAVKETFRGYGPEQGYAFLREKIAETDFRQRGIHIEPGEIFVGDGSKSDTGNIGDILGDDNRIAITNPVYPVYLDTTIMRIGKADQMMLLSCSEKNGFLPEIPSQRADVVYLCYPNNPTGTVMTRAELKKWVDWAMRASYSSMRPTRHLFRMKVFPGVSMRSRMRNGVPSNFGPTLRMPVSPVCAAVIRWCRKP